MRPIFTIYLAGLVLTFGLAAAFSYAYQAYAIHEPVAVLGPTGDDLVRMQSILQGNYEATGWALALVVIQVVIIIGARKLNQQSGTAQQRRV